MVPPLTPSFGPRAVHTPHGLRSGKARLRPSAQNAVRSKERGPPEDGPPTGYQLGVVRTLPAGVLGCRRRWSASPLRWLGDSPVGPGDTPLPAGTSTARTGIWQVGPPPFRGELTLAGPAERARVDQSSA